MSKRVSAAFLAVGVLLGITGVLLAQQAYPNAGEPEVVLENDRVIVQRIDQQPGDWTGMHSHDGNQLVVVLDDLTLTYKVGDEETEESRSAGDVFWIDAVEHDHKALGEGSVILITLK